jgi:hypothetical protein
VNVPTEDDPDNMEIVPINNEDWYAELLIIQASSVYREAISEYRNKLNSLTGSCDLFETIQAALTYLSDFTPSDSPATEKKAFKIGSKTDKGKDSKAKQIREKDREKAFGERKGKLPSKCKLCESIGAAGDWRHWFDCCPNKDNIETERNPKKKGKKKRDESDSDSDDEDADDNDDETAKAFVTKKTKRVKR